LVVLAAQSISGGKITAKIEIKNSEKVSFSLFLFFVILINDLWFLRHLVDRAVLCSDSNSLSCFGRAFSETIIGVAGGAVLRATIGVV
jgi:hypothetical protein